MKFRFCGALSVHTILKRIKITLPCIVARITKPHEIGLFYNQHVINILRSKVNKVHYSISAQKRCISSTIYKTQALEIYRFTRKNTMPIIRADMPRIFEMYPFCETENRRFAICRFCGALSVRTTLKHIEITIHCIISRTTKPHKIRLF